MGAIPVVKFRAIRATKIDQCGKPIEGPKNRLVTKGAIEFSAEPEMKNREELEQLNGEGKVCFADSTPPEVKRHNLSLRLCGVDPDLYALFNSYNEKILDYDDSVIGIGTSREVDTDYGVALEMWTLGKSDDDCEDNPTDALFSVQGSGTKFGYLLLGGKEWQTGNFVANAQVSDFTLTGISIPIPHWGRGPYNVARINADGDAGRLLIPVPKKRELTFFRTPIEPPVETDGACALAVQSIFTSPGNKYFGADATDVAPPQPICNGSEYDVVITGTGNWKAAVAGVQTANVAHTALPAALKTAIEALSNVEPGQVEVTGSAGNYHVVLAPELGTLTADGTGLTGGTATVTPA